MHTQKHSKALETPLRVSPGIGRLIRRERRRLICRLYMQRWVHLPLRPVVFRNRNVDGWMTILPSVAFHARRLPRGIEQWLIGNDRVVTYNPRTQKVT